MTKLITAAVAALAGALSLTSAAAAQNYSIRYGDLNLATAEGAETLRGRVAAAAHQFCATDTAGVTLLAANPRLCERRFTDEAMRQLPVSRQDDLAVAAQSEIMVAAR